MKSRIGLIVFLTVFVLASGMVAHRVWRPAVEKRTTIRFAHWQLEAGVRRAFDDVVADYERLHPDIRVEQIAIPDTMYPQWLQAQLAGGTAPEIVEYGWWYGRAAELQARYFEPLDRWLREPNPYNAGTPLAEVPWRHTFLDGLDNFDCYNPQMNQFFGLTLCTGSNRIFYNRTLLKEITGSDRTPRDYREFMALCEQITAYARARGSKLVPLAGSRDSATRIGDMLFEAAAMKTSYGLDYLHRLRLDAVEAALGFLRGEWNYLQPDFLAGLEMAREYCQQLDPGAMQLLRDSATLKFAGGAAVMFGTGSFDASSLKVLCPFEVGAFRIPFPTPEDPEFGRYIPGPISDGKVTTNFAFFVQRGTKNQAAAIDFLRYLSSVQGSQKFADESGWLSGVVGVKTTAYSEQYYPVLDGYGTNGSFWLLSGADAFQLFTKNFHYLLAHDGGPRKFADAMQEGLRPAIEADLDRLMRSLVRNQNQQDVALASRRILSVIANDRSHDAELENSASTLGEARTYRYLHDIAVAGGRTP